MHEQDVSEQCSNGEWWKLKMGVLAETVYAVLHGGGLNAELTYANWSFNLGEFPEVPPNFF